MKKDQEESRMPAAAYPYRRHSTKEQREGDSLRRQDAALNSFAREHGWRIDDSLKLYDCGVSAHRGKHRLVGALSRFLDAIKRGRVLPGDVLLVENIDRLTRENLREAWKLWEGILESGVAIAVGPPWVIYTVDSLDDPMLRMLPLMEMHRAWRESRRKSELLGAVWQQKQKQLRDSGKPLGGKCPGWLEYADGAFRIRPRVAAGILKAAELVRAGHGVRAVAAFLQANRDTYPPPGYSGKWQSGPLRRILRGREVLGELNSRHGTVKDYYPPIMAKKDWEAVQAAISSRYLTRGRPGKAVENLFTGLVHDATTGERCHVWACRGNRPAGACQWIYLVSGEQTILSRYDAFEACVLNLVNELRPEDVEPGKDGVSDIERRIDERNERRIAVDYALDLARQEYESAKGKPQAMKELLRSITRLSDEKEEILKDLERLKFDARTAGTESLTEAKSVLQIYRAAEGEHRFELARRLKQDLALLISEIWVLGRETGHKRRWIDVHVHLRSGVVKPAGFHAGRGKIAQDAFLPTLDDVDLRTWRETGGQ